MSARNNTPRRRAQDLLPGKTPDQYDGPCAECLALRTRELTSFLISQRFPREDAIEVVQDVVVFALSKLKENGARYFKDHRRWLWGAIRKAAIVSIRNRIRNRHCSEGLEDIAAPADDEIERLEQVRAVRAAVADLHEHSRRVLELRYFDGLTIADVAAQLGITQAVVKHRLVHARLELRARLEAGGFVAG